MDNLCVWAVLSPLGAWPSVSISPDSTEMGWAATSRTRDLWMCSGHGDAKRPPHKKKKGLAMQTLRGDLQMEGWQTPLSILFKICLVESPLPNAHLVKRNFI